MKGASGDAVLLHFPCLTPALAGAAVPGVLFLDPGLGEPGEPGRVRLAWRRAVGSSPGATAANALLERIARHTSENAGRSSIRN